MSEESWFIPAGRKSRSRNPRSRWWLLVPMALPQSEGGQVFRTDVGQWVQVAGTMCTVPGNQEIEFLLPASYLYLLLSLDLGPGTCQFSAVPRLSGLSFCPSVCSVTSITSVSICFFLCNDLGLCLWTLSLHSLFFSFYSPSLHSLHPFPISGL